MPHSSLRPPLLLRLLATGLGLAPALAFAQAAPAAAPKSATTGGDIVQLAAFTVSTEIGTYAEATADTGTKTGTLLRDAPLTVTVMNQAFIADLRAQRMGDIYQYITGLSYNDTRLSDGFSIRGMAGSSNIKNIQIDGLPGLGSRINTPASANIERVEVLKGPAGVLYVTWSPAAL